MEIVRTVPPKKTNSRKYMFVCKTCKRDENGFNYSKTKFIADSPKDFYPGITCNYCRCPVCGTLHYPNVFARLRYLWYEATIKCRLTEK